MKKIFMMTAMVGMLAMTCACGGGNDDEPEPSPSFPSTPENPETPSTDKDTTSTPTNPAEKYVVSFQPSLTGMTRATDTQFQTGDHIGVFVMKASAGDNRAIIADHGNYADNVVYTYDGARFTSTTGIELTADTKLFYAAVYPYTSNAANTYSFEVSTDQTTAAAFTASDLCTASTEATEAKVVDLKFSHRLSRLTINLTGEGWTGNNISAKLRNVMTTTSVNLNNLTFVGTGTKKDITCRPDGTRSYTVILPPQTVGQGEKLFTITMNGTEYSLDTPTALEFRSGKSYEFTISLDANKEVVQFTGDINPWNSDERINDVVPEDILVKMGPYIPIYRGSTPPNIEGTVYADPFAAVYCEDYSNGYGGGFAPGTIVSSMYIRFSNQNMSYNTLDIDQVSGSSTSTGTGAFISGTGNNFTAFFNTVGQSDGISTKTALVISGTKTASGISNLKYAFVMVEKGSDPEHLLMDEGIFRVFEDQDGMSQYTSWPGANARSLTLDKSDVTKSVFSKN